MSEHATVSVDEVMLFQRVQDNGYTAVEELSKPRIRVPGTMRANALMRITQDRSSGSPCHQQDESCPRQVIHELAPVQKTWG